MLALAAALTGFTGADASDVVVLQSARLKPYEAALQAFRSNYAGPSAAGPKSVVSLPFSEVLLTGTPGDADLLRQLKTRRPALLVAVGAPALALLGDVADIPILYLMVPTPERLVRGRTNVTGVTLTLSPERWIEALAKSLPHVRRPGVVYDPGTHQEFIRAAAASAKARGIVLEARQARSPKEFFSAASSLRNTADCLWMLPDASLLTPETVDLLLLLALESRVPVLTFSERYLDLGATVAVSIDPVAIGEQAARMALRLAAGTRPDQLPPSSPERVRISFNPSAAKKLGLDAREDYSLNLFGEVPGVRP